MIAKGRMQHYQNMAKGSNHGMATVDEDTALRIFNSGGRLDDIATEFSVGRNLVENIKYGRTWNHVTGLPRRRNYR
jgi:hypothetical protein